MQAVRACRVLAEAGDTILLVGLEVAFEPVPLGRVVVVAFPREDMRGDTVEVDGETVIGAKDGNDIDAIRRFAVAWLRREQNADLDAYAVAFDNWFLES